MNNPIWSSQYPVPLLDPSATGIAAYLDSIKARLASHKGMISLRELQSATGEELTALLPSVLDRALKGEL